MRASGLAIRTAGAGLLLALFVTGTGATCEQQDFAAVGEVLEVSASQGRPADTLAEPIEHDVITRHAVDYNVTSASATDPVEVVVEATSSVNGVERATGRAVLRLPASESVHGRIPDLQLEVGDRLDLSLQCCQASQCISSELLCPEALAEGATAPDPLVCLEGCDRLDACDDACAVDATRAECETDCPDDDTACLASCATACQQTCESRTVACAANCLAFYRRCLSLAVPTTTGPVPCALCDATATGLCDPATLPCSPGAPTWPRQRYPAQCMTVCTDDAEFDPADTAGRFACLESCVLTHQRANNLDPNGVDDDLRVTSPCCYAQTCEARMSAVVKLDAVECFDDADCGSERECNERLICVNRLREEQSGCQVVGPRRGDGGPEWPWAIALIGVLGWLGRRRVARHGTWPGAKRSLQGVVPRRRPGRSTRRDRREKSSRNSSPTGHPHGSERPSTIDAPLSAQRSALSIQVDTDSSSTTSCAAVSQRAQRAQTTQSVGEAAPRVQALIPTRSALSAQSVPVCARGGAAVFRRDRRRRAQRCGGDLTQERWEDVVARRLQAAPTGGRAARGPGHGVRSVVGGALEAARACRPGENSPCPHVDALRCGGGGVLGSPARGFRPGQSLAALGCPWPRCGVGGGAWGSGWFGAWRALLGLLLALAVCWPAPVEAEPARFRRTRSTFSVGLTSGTFLVGAVGGATGAGLGLSAQQTLSSGYWGGSVRIGASVYATERGELVFDQGIQTYYVAAGPRLVIPTFDETELYVYVQPEYMLEGIQSNALVELTGSVAPFVHGPGGVIGTSLVLEPLALDLGVGFTWLFPVQTGQLTVTLGAGFSGIL